MDYWYVGVWRVYMASWMSACLSRGRTIEELVALSDFYSLVSRNLAAIAIAKREEEHREKSDTTEDKDKDKKD